MSNANQIPAVDLRLDRPGLPVGEDVVVIVAVLGIVGGLLALLMPDPAHMTLAFVALTVLALWPALAVSRLRSMADRRPGRSIGASWVTSIGVFAVLATGTVIWALGGLLVAGGALRAFMRVRDFGAAGTGLVVAAMIIAGLRFASRYVMALPLAANGGLSARECFTRSREVSRSARGHIAAVLFGLALIAGWGIAAALHFGPENRAIAIAAIVTAGSVWIVVFARWLLSRLDTLCAFFEFARDLDDLQDPAS